MYLLKRTQNGFTIIELIAVLLILGVLAVGASMGFLSAVRGAVFTQKNTDALVEAQHQIGRMVIELSSACQIVSFSSSSLTYKYQQGSGTSSTRTLNAPSGASFSFSDNSITITMTVAVADERTKTFVTRVTPYNLVSGYGCIE